MQGGSSLAQLAMETTSDGKKAFYGPSHSAATGRSNLAFFEIPRSPTLSLASFQHCDLTATAFGCASQIANSWASPYLSAQRVARTATYAPSNESIGPAGSASMTRPTWPTRRCSTAISSRVPRRASVPQVGHRQPRRRSQDQISESVRRWIA